MDIVEGSRIVVRNVPSYVFTQAGRYQDSLIRFSIAAKDWASSDGLLESIMVVTAWGDAKIYILG